MELKSMAQEKSYIYLERYVNEFKKVANEVSKDFCAIQGSQSYTLPYTKLSRNKVSLFISKPNKLIYKKFVGSKIFNCNKDFFSAVDYKITTWLVGVFALCYKVFPA